MSRVVVERITRRIVLGDGRWIVRELAWHIEQQDDGRVLRRTLIDRTTGEILDAVWVDDDGRVRPYSAPPRRLDAPDGVDSVGVETVVSATAGADDDVIEDGGDDRPLPGQGQVGPALPQAGGVADVPVEDRDAA